MATSNGINPAPSGGPKAAAAIAKSAASPFPSGPSTRSLVFATMVLSSFTLILFLVATILYACSKRKQLKRRQNPLRDPEATPAIASTSEAVKPHTAAKVPGPLNSNPIVPKSSVNTPLYKHSMAQESGRRKASSDCTTSCASGTPTNRGPAPSKRIFKVYEASKKQPKGIPPPNFSAPLPGINRTTPSTNPTLNAGPANPVKKNGPYSPQRSLNTSYFRPISYTAQVFPVSPISPVNATVSAPSPIPEPLRPTSTYGLGASFNQQRTKLSERESVRLTLELAGEDVRHALLEDRIPENGFEEVDIYFGGQAPGRAPVDSVAGSPI